MFTGIVETTGVIEDLNYDNENLNLSINVPYCSSNWRVAY